MKFDPRKFLTAFVAVLLLATAVLPQQKTVDTDKELKQARERAEDAAKAFNEIMSRADKSIPRELLDRAEAVAIFPGVLKAAFIVGGRGGEGLISRRTPQGWSAPAFFKLGGGSIGFQIGADKTDYIMLFQNDGGLKGLLEDKFEFGGDAGVAAGPVGREVSATTNATLDAGIFSYSRSKGAFIGAALKGSRIAPDNDRNRALYGKTAKEILNSDALTPIPEAVRVFGDTLSRYSTRKGAAIDGKNPNATRQRTAINVGNDNAIVVGSAPRTENTENNADTPAPSVARGEVFTASRMTARPTNRLAREIRAELLDLPGYDVFNHLEFEILPDNAVVLRGQVTRPSTKSDAESFVKEISGVSSVNNEIEVLPDSSSDEKLRGELYRAVYSGQLFRYGTGSQQPVRIIVNRGRVTLKGFVDTESDKNFAGLQAGAVPGAFDVRNELMVTGK